MTARPFKEATEAIKVVMCDERDLTTLALQKLNVDPTGIPIQIQQSMLRVLLTPRK